MSHIAIGLSLLILLHVLPALYSPRKFKEAIEEFLNAGNTAMRISGILMLFIALFILNSHWTIKLSSNRSIMTVLGYFLVVGGIVKFWFPNFARANLRKLMHDNTMIYVCAVIGLLVAFGLGYLGFVLYR